MTLRLVDSEPSDYDPSASVTQEQDLDALLRWRLHFRETGICESVMGWTLENINSAIDELEGLTGVVEGKRLAGVINRRIDSMVSPKLSRPTIIRQMAELADTNDSTVSQTLRAEIVCPPQKRLEGFAKALRVSVRMLISAARQDGCKY